MSRNERTTCKELIEPALAHLGWTWDEQLRIGPGRVNLTGDTMYDDSQAIIADYQLRYRASTKPPSAAASPPPTPPSF